MVATIAIDDSRQNQSGIGTQPAHTAIARYFSGSMDREGKKQ